MICFETLGLAYIEYSPTAAYGTNFEYKFELRTTAIAVFKPVIIC
jgi:hypothetical protein